MAPRRSGPRRSRPYPHRSRIFRFDVCSSDMRQTNVACRRAKKITATRRSEIICVSPRKTPMARKTRKHADLPDNVHQRKDGRLAVKKRRPAELLEILSLGDGTAAARFGSLRWVEGHRRARREGTRQGHIGQPPAFRGSGASHTRRRNKGNARRFPLSPPATDGRVESGRPTPPRAALLGTDSRSGSRAAVRVTLKGDASRRRRAKGQVSIHAARGTTASGCAPSRNTRRFNPRPRAMGRSSALAVLTQRQ
jgi:hypothetical protein